MSERPARATAPLVVAIDGPAGAGKSTISARLAERLSLPHVDSGAYYRAATLAVLRAGADPDDATACASITRRVRIGRMAGRTLLDGEDVEEAIRGAEVTAVVSTVSAHADVRAVLVTLQRAEVGHAGGVVEGRDAGTVIVPHADLKVWLTATTAERALRRAAQSGGFDTAAVAGHERAIARRDGLDRARMTPARDAVVVDTTGRAVSEVVEQIARLALDARVDQAPGAPE